jgi:TolB-like protein/Tfp pilus assembly protein PilF
MWPLLIAVATAVIVGYIGIDRYVLHKGTQRSVAPATTANADKSIAVLPFVDLSEKHDQEYFADGMAEEVLDLLAKIPELKVIGRTSSFQFKGKNQDLRAVGNALGAKYLVEGSVRKSGDRVRVTAQLIDAADGSHVWSDTYDESVGDALRIQDKIATNLVRALQVTVGADFEVEHPFKSVKAHELYLRGRHAYDRFDKEGLESAASYFQQALDLEPDSVAAAEALTSALDDLAEFGFVAPDEGFERARHAALSALQLDPNSAMGHSTLADVHLVYEWDWAAAEREAKEAVRLKPHSHSAMGVLGMVYLALGHWDESARMLEGAIDVDPLFAEWHSQLSNVRFAQGRLDAAEAEARKMIQISPTYAGAHGWLGSILLKEGKLEEALAQTQQEQPDYGRAAVLATVYHAMGRHAESDLALAQEIKEHAQGDALGIADAYAFRGEADQAFAWLERAYRQKDGALYQFKIYSNFSGNLANDPRYKAFLHKMNLPE